MKQKTYIYNNIVFDSKEEIEFNIFLEEAKKHKLIKSFVYQPPSFELIPKATYIDNKTHKQKVLFRSHSYTADFLIYPNKLFNELNHGLIPNNDGSYLIDVKGIYNRNGGDRILPIHQKLLFDKYKLVLNKVVPSIFFKRANIAPEGLRWNKTLKTKKVLRKDFKNLDSFKDFLKNVKEKRKSGKQINIKYLG